MEETLKILVVDDDEVDRMAVRRALKQAGIQFDLREVPNCQSAIATLKQEAFDCAVLDYRLPDGDGLSLVQQIRQGQFPVALIVLTGQGDEEVAVELMKAGVSDYLAKGRLTTETLGRSLRNAVRIHRAEIQAAEATEKLRASEERYRLVLEGANDGIWDWELCKREIYCNDRLFEIIGMSRAALGSAQDHFYQLIHPDDRPRVVRAITDHMEQGNAFEIEFRLLHHSGEYRYCTSRGKAQRNDRGIPFRMSGVISDITERKRAEAELEARARQQAAIAQLGQQALAGSHLETLMHQAVTLLAQTLQVEYTKVLELQPDGTSLKLVAGVGWRSGLVGQATVSTDLDSQAGYTLQVDEPVIVRDLAQDTRFSGPPLLHQHGVVSGMSVVIRGQDPPYGVLGIHTRQQRHFSQDDCHFLQAVANILATAIQKRRAETEVTKLNQNLQRRIGELQTLLDVIPIGIGIAEDPHCRKIRVNPSLSRLLGVSPDQDTPLSPATEPPIPPFQVFQSNQRLNPSQFSMQYAATHGVEVSEAEVDLVHADGTVIKLLEYAAPLFDEQGKVRGGVGAFLDITERKRVEEAQRFLAEASSLLSDSLDYHVTLQNLAKLVVPCLADWCAITIPDEIGVSLAPVAIVHRDPEKVEWAKQLSLRYPPPPDAPRGVPQVLRTGQSEFYPEVSDALLIESARDERHLQLLRQVGFHSVMVVPLLARGRTQGVITFVTAESKRRYTPEDLALAEDLAHRAALAVDNARLYQSTQEAEHNLRRTIVILGEHQQQLRTLQRLTDLLNQELTDLPNLLQVMVRAIYDAIPDAEFGLIVLQNPQTQQLELTAAAGEGMEEFQSNGSFSVGSGLLGQIFLTGEAQLLCSPSLTGDTCLDLSSSSRGLPASLGAVAIESARAGRLGVLAVGSWTNPNAFEEEDLRLLGAFGEQAAIALNNAQLISDLEEREDRLAEQNEVLAQQNRELETQRQQIQLQNLRLLEASHLKSQFLATMSHELRTPMNAIIGFSQLLLRQQQESLSPQQANMVERILNNGKNLLVLINDILDLSRIEAGGMELQADEFDLHSLIRRTAEELRSLADQKQLDLYLHLDLQNPLVVNDPTRLRQILVNLLSNAIKFTETGSVGVKAMEVGNDRVALIVQDTGIGIARDDLDHIFEEFRQLDQTLAKRYPGTGLGLTITDWLVRMMNGTITVESQVGQGSTFRVEIPRQIV